MLLYYSVILIKYLFIYCILICYLRILRILHSKEFFFFFFTFCLNGMFIGVGFIPKIHSGIYIKHI